MKKRLQLKTKTKLKTRLSVKLAIGGAAFATIVAVCFLVYINFGTSTDSIASDQNQPQGYNWRKKLIISKDLVKGNNTLFNFPLLVSITDPDLRHISSGGKVISRNAADIRFTKTKGLSILHSQIEEYNPETGELNAWVLMDTLKPGSNELFVYYSNSAEKSFTGDVVWFNGFNGVWHMNGSLNGNSDRKLRASVSGTSTIKGKIGNARSFNSESKDCAWFDYYEPLNKNGDFSISAWINLKQNGKEQVIISNQGDQPGGYRLFVGQDNQLGMDFINVTGKHSIISGSGENLQKDHWYHIAATFNSKENKITTYIDGISDRNFLNTGVPALTASSLQIGRDQFSANSYFNGYIDELRVSGVERNQGWLATEFYNQSLASSLFTVGAPEELIVDAASIKKNKDAMHSMAAEQASKEEAANRMNAQKTGTGAAPKTVSSNPEVIQSRLDNIKRVSDNNSK